MTTRYFLSSTNSDLTGGADFSKKLVNAPGFTSTLAVTVAASATEQSYGFTEPLIPGKRGSVGVQEYIVNVKVIVAANQNLKVQLHRITAAGTVQLSSGYTPTQSLNSTGIKEFQVYFDLGAFEKDTRIRIDYSFTDLTGAGSTVTIETEFGDTTFIVPWDAGLLKPNMRVALDSAYVVGAWLVEMDLPSPVVGGSVTEVRAALQGASQASIGDYPQKVTSISRLPMGVTLSTPGMESPEVTIVWEDTDNQLSPIIEGPNGDDVVGSAVRIRFAVQGLAESDWHTRFAGLIRKRRFIGSSMSWEITIGPEDRKLTRGEVPRHRVSKSDFPDSPDDNVDVPAPEIFGVWNSVGVSGTGCVPTVYVDTKLFRYLVSHGPITIKRVYKDGVLLAAGAWTQLHYTVNGRLFTLVDFTTDQGNAEITCDVDGYLQITATVIERPIEVLYTWLENFVVLDGNTGITSVFPPAIMNGTHIEELRDLYEDDFGLIAAAHVSEVRTADSHLRDFLTSWNYRAYWGVDGKFSIKAIDHRSTAIYLDEPWVRGSEDCVEAPNVPYEDKDAVDRVTIYYLQDAAADAFVESLEVRDPNEQSNISESFEMSWGAASII